MNILITGLVQKAHDMQSVIHTMTSHQAICAEAGLAAEHTRAKEYDVVVVLAQSPYTALLQEVREIRGVPVIVVTHGQLPLNSTEMTSLFRHNWAVVLHQPSLDAILAQAESLLRFMVRQPEPEFRVANLACNLNTQLMRIGETSVILSPQEFAILETLIRRPEQFVPTLHLCESVFGDMTMQDEGKALNNLQVLIYKLRKKITRHTKQVVIHSQRFRGYMLTQNPIYVG